MLSEIIFLVLAAVILGAAIKMLAADEPVHAAIYLGLVLGGVAGIYLTLGAEFLAAIQLLIYVGAVVTLILFAVMLTTHAAPAEDVAIDRTPLSALGFGDAPPGLDVESLEEVPSGAETVEEAEEHARPDRGEESTVRRDHVEDEPGDAGPADEAEPGEGGDADAPDTGDEPADEPADDADTDASDTGDADAEEEDR